MDIQFTPREVKTILLNRERIERRLIDKFNLSYFELADYFEVSVKCIKKDLGNNGDGRKKEDTATLIGLKKARNRKIQSFLGKGKDEKKVLIAMGMWRMPADLMDNLILPDSIPSERENLIREAHALIHRGIAATSVYTYLGLRKNEIEILKNRDIITSDEDAVRFGVSLVLYGASAEDVSRLTGLSKSHLARITGNKNLEDSIKQYNSRSQYYRKRMERKKKKSKQEELLARRLRVYEFYLQGLLQKDIAKELGVTRETVGNDWREIKAEYDEPRRKNNKGSLN